MTVTLDEPMALGQKRFFSGEIHNTVDAASFGLVCGCEGRQGSHINGVSQCGEQENSPPPQPCTIKKKWRGYEMACITHKPLYQNPILPQCHMLNWLLNSMTWCSDPETIFLDLNLSVEVFREKDLWHITLPTPTWVNSRNPMWTCVANGLALPQKIIAPPQMNNSDLQPICTFSWMETPQWLGSPGSLLAPKLPTTNPLHLDLSTFGKA